MMTHDKSIVQKRNEQQHNIDAEDYTPQTSYVGSKNRKKFIYLFKIILPVIALILLTLLILWPQINDTKPIVQKENITENTKKNVRGRLVEAQYDSQDSKGRPYKIIAKEAVQDKMNAELIYLSSPNANIQVSEDTQISLESLEGEYFQDKEKLHLKKNVILHHQNGDKLFMEEVTVLVDTGQAESITPVSGQGPSGNLQAKGMKIIDMGKKIIFTGPAILIMDGHKPDNKGIRNKE